MTIEQQAQITMEQAQRTMEQCIIVEQLCAKNGPLHLYIGFEQQPQKQNKKHPFFLS